MNPYPFDLNEATTLILQPLEGDDRIKVVVEQEINSETETVVSERKGKDFYDVPQKRRTLANKIETDAPFDGEGTKEDFLTWCKEFGAQDAGEERKRALRSPIVNQLLDETRAVKAYAGEQTFIEVKLTHGGHSGTIEFTPAEWTGQAAGKLTSAYYNEFLEKIQVTGDDFEELTDEWDERKEIVTRESLTGWQTVVSRVVDGIRTAVRRTVHEDKSKLKNDEYGAWFDASNSEPIVWVRSSGVINELEETGKDASQVSQLSAELKKRKVTADSTKQKVGYYCYPFYAEELGISKEDVHADVDETGGVEP